MSKQSGGRDVDRGAKEMPLFPLNTVLFPGMKLPLQIFEARYHMMIRHCLEHGGRFGVALINEGKEVGETAQVWPVGTVVRSQRIPRFSERLFRSRQLSVA